MKLIKFDLPINGTKVRNIEELCDNFTTEILNLYASGVLLKWLKSRNLMTEAEKLAAVAVDNDADKLIALCDIFGIDADRSVIEAALSKGQASQGAALRQDPEELKYKEKFEKLSELLEGLKSKKLYITQEEYNRFVKDKIQIEQEGQIVCVDLSDANFIAGGRISINSVNNAGFSYRTDIKIGDVIEAGEVIGFFEENGRHGFFRMFPDATIKSPVRGILVDMGEKIKESSFYRVGDPICYIKVDHDTEATIKIIPS